MPEGLENVVVTSSEICFIDGQKGELIYRGYDIHDLAQNATFEEVVHLLWHGKLPNQSELNETANLLKEERNIPEEVVSLIRSMPKSETPMGILRTAVSFLGAFDPDAGNLEPEARIRKARRLTAKIATIVATICRIRQDQEIIAPDSSMSHAENFLYMLQGKKPDEESVKTMDVALTLHAEHGFNASTFTGRVIAATLSDIYSGVVGAIGALKGPLHGGANTAVMNMLLEIGDLDKIETWVAGALAKKEKIMGMGHRVYKAMDPRADELITLSKKMGERVGNTKWLEMSEKIQQIVHAQKGLYPNVDFYSASTYYTMGIQPEMFTLIFAVSRISGWTAHIIEQLTHNRLIRPRAEYTGKRDQKFVPIDDRS